MICRTLITGQNQMAGVVLALKAKPLVVIALLLGSKCFFTFEMWSSRIWTRSRWWFHETTFIALFFINFARSLLGCDIEYTPLDLIAWCKWLRCIRKLWDKGKWDPSSLSSVDFDRDDWRLIINVMGMVRHEGWLSRLIRIVGLKRLGWSDGWRWTRGHCENGMDNGFLIYKMILCIEWGRSNKGLTKVQNLYETWGFTYYEREKA